MNEQSKKTWARHMIQEGDHFFNLEFSIIRYSNYRTVNMRIFIRFTCLRKWMNNSELVSSNKRT